jgi:putative transposase
MANAYSQVTIHVVFAVRGRQHIITKDWRDELHRYIAGMITKKGGKCLAVGGWVDHIHLFFGMPVSISIADFIGAIKSCSSKWINKRGFISGQFHWQQGYGVFSYARSQRDIVIRYIMNQEEHHRKKTFKEEYCKILSDFNVSYQEEYLFEFY